MIGHYVKGQVLIYHVPQSILVLSAIASNPIIIAANLTRIESQRPCTAHQKPKIKKSFVPHHLPLHFSSHVIYELYISPFFRPPRIIHVAISGRFAISIALSLNLSLYSI